MNKEKQIDYARRVSQANRTELVVITFDIVIDNIDAAVSLLEKNEVTGYRHELKMAQGMLGELMRSLDYSYPLSAQLLQLYEYVQRILIASEVSGSDKGLVSAKNVVERLRSAFSDISSQDTSGSVMENAQQIYAGLTYGRGTLNESDMAAGSNRGYTV